LHRFLQLLVLMLLLFHQRLGQPFGFSTGLLFAALAGKVIVVSLPVPNPVPAAIGTTGVKVML
jgi:hypothetical protein